VTAERRRLRFRDAMRRLWRRLRGGEFSPVRLALSVATGLFVGCQPVYGLHFPLCAAVCLPFKLDLVAAYLAANISNPLMAPFLVVLEVNVGSYLLTGQPAPFDVARAREAGISGFVAQAVVGSLVVGAALAAGGGLVAYLIARRYRSDDSPPPVDVASP
jgi:uncharacterized protein (DUF2062 family)